jgi:hypothetical protein
MKRGEQLQTMGGRLRITVATLTSESSVRNAHSAWERNGRTRTRRRSRGLWRWHGMIVLLLFSKTLYQAALSEEATAQLPLHVPRALHWHATLQQRCRHCAPWADVRTILLHPLHFVFESGTSIALSQPPLIIADLKAIERTAARQRKSYKFPATLAVKHHTCEHAIARGGVALQLFRKIVADAIAIRSVVVPAPGHSTVMTRRILGASTDGA